MVGRTAFVPQLFQIAFDYAVLAMMAEADVLILDEPTSALDLKNLAVILGWITMPGLSQFVHRAASCVLTEANLRALYGVAMRKLSFQHGGRTLQTVVPVLDAQS